MRVLTSVTVLSLALLTLSLLTTVHSESHDLVLTDSMINDGVVSDDTATTTYTGEVFVPTDDWQVIQEGLFLEIGF